MSRRYSVLLIAALWCSAAPVSAQAGDARAHDVGVEHASYGRRLLRDYARCVAGISHDASQRFVLVTGTQRLKGIDAFYVLHGSCAGAGTPDFLAKELQFKGMLAEALNAREHKQWPALDPTGIPPIDWSVPDFPPDKKKRLDPDRKALVEQLHEMAIIESKVGRLGECAVRVNPAAAAAVLQTPIDEPAELMALQRMTPEIAACIKAGETASFTRTDLRAAIGLSYYRLLNAKLAAISPRSD
jgi:hypothetical protein